MSNRDAFVSLLKCAIGIGCLAMPRALASAGWLIGVISIIVIGIITVYALHILLQGMYELCQRNRVPQLSYHEAMTLALRVGPPFLRCFHSYVGKMVDFTMAFYHFGVCCVYVVFIAENLKDVGDNYLTPLDSRLYMCLLIVPLLLVYMVLSLYFRIY